MAPGIVVMEGLVAGEGVVAPDDFVNAVAMRGVKAADIAVTRVVLLALIENLARDEQDKRMPSTRDLARLGARPKSRPRKSA